MVWLSFLSVFTGNTVSETSSVPLMVNGILGESVTLPLEFSAEEKITSITWLHDRQSIIFIQPKEAQSPLILVTDPKRNDRLNVTKSYSLQLSNLTMADTGSYTAQIATASLVFYSYDLRIFRRLRNLQVVSHTESSGNETCAIHLTCSVEDPNDNILFSWQASGSTLLREANLTVSWDPKNFRDETYMCVAENPVSNASSSVSAQTLCKGNRLSQASLSILSSCGCCIPQALHHPQNSNRKGGNQGMLGEERHHQELCASHSILLPLPQQPLLQPTQSPRAKSLGKKVCFLHPTRPLALPGFTLRCLPNGTPSPRKPAQIPRPSGY
uniref:Ig-like domain-containing protein n=1 Tax=Catagonus wagneri TaxID=51154 RepID=A0A8C3WH40_9CETA